MIEERHITIDRLFEKIRKNKKPSDIDTILGQLVSVAQVTVLESVLNDMHACLPDYHKEVVQEYYNDLRLETDEICTK